MRPAAKVGIAGYGAYIPIYRLPADEIARVWKGGGSGPNVEKSVASLDEDTVTMAVEAARAALRMAGLSDVGAVFVGTESKPYAVKPSSTVVAQALGFHKVLAADFEFACKAGTEAIQVIIGLVGSGMVGGGVAIAVDTAQGRPGDDLEYTAASGAAAFVLANNSNDSVARIESSVSYVTDTGDFWRRQEEKFPKHLSRFTGEPAYFHHTQSSVKMLLEEMKLKPQDFKYAVFHQPNPRFPVEVAQRLGFTQEQIQPGLLNPLIGNTYSASSSLGLIAILDIAKSGDMILFASFGSGAGSDAFCLVVEDGIEEKRKKTISIREMIANSRKIDYGTYAKFREVLHR